MILGLAVIALGLLAGFLASGDAHAQEAAALGFDTAEPSSSTPTIEARLSVSAQVSLVWRKGQQVVAAVTNFADSQPAAAATPETVLALLQRAAVSALGQAAAAGAETGHVDVVATAYQFAGTVDTLHDWAPVGVFINTTDMALDATGHAAFHTHAQFLPDQARTALAAAVPQDSDAGPSVPAR